MIYKSIDLFAGIGGIRKGFENVFKDKLTTVFVSEFDKHAQTTYRINFNDSLSSSNGSINLSIPCFAIKALISLSFQEPNPL